MNLAHPQIQFLDDFLGMRIEEFEMRHILPSHTTDREQAAIGSVGQRLGGFAEWEGSNQLTGSGIPKSKLVIFASGGKLASVGMKRHAGDAAFMAPHDNFLVG